MYRLRFLSKIEQVAVYLREQLTRGKWNHELPGREELAIELGVNAKTVESALRILEQEGLLIAQGAGRRRRIATQTVTRTAQKITVMLYERSDCLQASHNELIHQLTHAGHVATLAEKSLLDLNMDPDRVAKYVKTIETDAWVVSAGSREILEWFSQQPVPIYAAFGRAREIPISSVRIDKIPAMQSAVKRLIEWGHRRIVLLVRTDRRKPTAGLYERMFLEELEAHGIATGPYNLPDWENDIDDYHRCLASLYGKTPPTALFIDEAPHFFAAQLFLSRRGISVPRDVSMICHDPDLAFAWCDPVVSHFHWDARPFGSSVLKWANRLAIGNHEIKRSLIHARFIEGGTIGPAPKA